MKKTVLTLAACAVFIIGSSTVAFAQLKIGHIDTQEVLKLMPERDSASKIFEKFNAEITKNFEEMNVNYNNMVETYTKQKDSLSDFIRKAKEAELVDMNGKIQNFREVAQQELDKKQQELMAPIVDKLKKAIKAVAEANKFTYVIDAQEGGLMYVPEDESLNLLPLVKAKLGIK
jgi:outer membrane protein